VRKMDGNQEGFMMLEALVAMALILATGSGMLWFMHRMARNVVSQNTNLQPRCEQPVCSSSYPRTECACGTERFLIIR
jgi:Tfp pilus assembly protein PilV